MMKTIALYYSLDDKTRRTAVSKAKSFNADLLVEIKELKQRSKFNIRTSGILEAMRRKKSVIEPFDADLSDYGTIIIFMETWGGYPAPVMNNIIELIPAGKDVEIYMTSSGGDSEKSADKTSDEIRKRGSLVTKYVDLKIL